MLIHFKLLRDEESFVPNGFWLCLLKLIGFGLKNTTDDRGTYVMISFQLWRLEFHFTIGFNK
tara:strand:+ start:3311 stop:3496 length:186 start_codon:yes stop_codon:yes gene_type:complete